MLPPGGNRGGFNVPWGSGGCRVVGGFFVGFCGVGVGSDASCGFVKVGSSVDCIRGEFEEFGVGVYLFLGSVRFGGGESPPGFGFGGVSVGVIKFSDSVSFGGGETCPGFVLGKADIVSYGSHDDLFRKICPGFSFRGVNVKFYRSCVSLFVREADLGFGGIIGAAEDETQLPVNAVAKTDEGVASGERHPRPAALVLEIEHGGRET